MPHSAEDALFGGVLSMIHSLAWSVYIGGAICMEAVLRYAQQFMKPSQTAYVCEFSGKRYRWWSAVCLTILIATGVPMIFLRGLHETPYLLVVLLLTGLWAAQVAILALLALRVHPDMHARLLPSMSPEEMKRERARVGQAIVRMDRTLRLELAVGVVAMLAGSMLHLGRAGGV